MKCPSCGYVSFDEVERCKQCGADLNLSEEERNIFSFEEEGEEKGTIFQKSDDGIREEDWHLENEKTAEDRIIPFKEEIPKADQKAARADQSEGESPGTEQEVIPAQENKPPVQEDKKPAETIKKEFHQEKAEVSPSDALLEGIFENWEETEPESRQDSDSASVRNGDTVDDIVFEDFSIELEEPSAEGTIEEPAVIERESVKPGAVEEKMLPLERGDEVPSFFPGVESACFTKRAAAILVDNIMILLLVALYIFGAGLGLALKGVSLSWLAGNLWPLDAIVPFFLLSVIISGAYYVFTQWISGRTPGKRLFSLKVVNDKGESLSLATSFFLWMAYIVSAVPLGLGFMWALFDNEGRCWHDRLTRTMVVNDKNESS